MNPFWLIVLLSIFALLPFGAGYRFGRLDERDENRKLAPDQKRVFAALAASEAARKEAEEALVCTTVEQAIASLQRGTHALLGELGWKDARYPPKPDDTAVYDLIELGSNGIHEGSYDENAVWWISDEHDSYPSSPSFYRARSRSGASR